MLVVLFRHGIAVDREEWSGEESQRPLTPKGIKRAREAAKGLLALELAPIHLLTSPLARALETAKLVREALKPRVDLQIRHELLPDANPDKMIQVLAEFDEDACVVCVGHEPHLGDLAGVMLFGKPGAGLALKKAGACLIRFDAVPKAGRGHLQWWLTSSQLRLMANT